MIPSNVRFFTGPRIFTLALCVAFTMPVLSPRPAAASDRGLIAGAIIGGVAAAIIAGQVARSATRHDVPPAPRRVRTSKKKAPVEQANASATASADEKTVADPFAGVTPARMRSVSGN